VDNDCDGLTDEVCTCDGLGNTITELVCGMDICTSDPKFYLASSFNSPSGVSAANMQGQATEAVTKFGTPANLNAKAGGSYALVSSGNCTQTTGYREVNLADVGYTDPWDATYTSYDAVEVTVTLKAPSNALGFSFEYIFFSAEYDEYISSPFNDKFYTIMNTNEGGGYPAGSDNVINFTICRDMTSGGYYDFIDATACAAHPFGHCCYLAVNNSYSECCWYPHDSWYAPNWTDPPCPSGVSDFSIAGTGFSCAADFGADSSAAGSSTEWLTTTMPVTPNDTFKLRFHIHDMADSIYDSEVIIDNFKWSASPVTQGTFPS
jgi:hypothetical protein